MKLSKRVEALADKVRVLDFKGEVPSKELRDHIQEAWAHLDEVEAPLAQAGF
jgi:hypothetical protein